MADLPCRPLAIAGFRGVRRAYQITSSGLLFADGILQIFAKSPCAARVKTRLAAAIGVQAATRLATGLIVETVRRLADREFMRTELWYTPDPRCPVFAALRFRTALRFRPQCGAQLGQRMLFALRHGLGQADYVVIVGTDCPALNRQYLQRACSALREGTELVIGPARDGGYVLLGTRVADPHLFHGIPWGGPKVLQTTLQRARRLGCRTLLLDPLADIDRVQDLARLSYL